MSCKDLKLWHEIPPKKLRLNLHEKYTADTSNYLIETNVNFAESDKAKKAADEEIQTSNPDLKAPTMLGA